MVLSDVSHGLRRAFFLLPPSLGLPLKLLLLLFPRLRFGALLMSADDDAMMITPDAENFDSDDGAKATAEVPNGKKGLTTPTLFNHHLDVETFRVCASSPATSSGRSKSLAPARAVGKQEVEDLRLQFG